MNELFPEFTMEQKSRINLAMWKAFFCGWSFGEGKMEEDMDNNFFDALLQVGQVRKDMGVNHSVAIPNTIQEIKGKDGKFKLVSVPDLNGKYVRYKLHSDKWRNARLAKKEEFLGILKNLMK